MTRDTVDLIWIGSNESRPYWPLGEIYSVDSSPQAIHALLQQLLPHSEADAFLFWHSSLGVPLPDLIVDALSLPGDVWHAGLRLGQGGLPHLIDYIVPTWMLNRDPAVDIEATSWRISLSGCLILTDVLQTMGGIHPGFITLNGAALEMGHRYITRGVLIRHIPWLIPSNSIAPPSLTPFDDELRMVNYRFGTFWTRWAVLRAMITCHITIPVAIGSLNRLSRMRRPPEPPLYRHSDPVSTISVTGARVTVLLPTIGRYPYLRTLLAQLRKQTVQPYEIIVVDQTSSSMRDPSMNDDFTDLPLQIIYLEEPGQCTSRNVGLNCATGDYILFLDDDDEVKPTLIEAHLRNLIHFRADVSSGVADEVGAGPLPLDFTFLRASNVFPTNNTMIRRDSLHHSGLFDLAYDRGQRADGDLGMRMYLSGRFMILDPNICVLHHHAPSGGLRTHKARVVTYASSRNRLTHRHIPSMSEIYLAMRYFTPRQVRENLWMRALGTLSGRGSKSKKVWKAVIGLILLPNTWWRIHRRYKQASSMLRTYPQIPQITSVNTVKDNE